jgi:hypothetical protein
MTRIAGRLLMTTLTLCIGLGVDALLRTKIDDSKSDHHPTTAITTPTVHPAAIPSPANTIEIISQESIVRFPRLGEVRVCAHEDFGKAPRLTFIDQRSGQEILSSYVGRFDWPWTSDQKWANMNPKLRFKAISIKGLPDPLVIGIAMSPGGSDCDWQAIAVGVVDGRLELLTYETMETSDEGGFFFGDLGYGIGLGAAQWDFVWGEDEGHPPPHKYEVKLFKWNGWRFEWYRVFRTARTYNSPHAALKAYGLHFKDVRLMFPEWADLDSSW